MSRYTVHTSLTPQERESLNTYSDLVAHLLFHRGLTTNETAQAFINPDFEAHTHDPFLLKDMDTAVDRILHAIASDQKIAIYSDYDADGIPAAVIMNDFFREIGYTNVTTYIPHRNKEGFGLHKQAIKKLHDQGAELIITLDCGISDVEQVAYANELGIDVIITDHHEAHEVLPPAHAIINPKQPNCQYPEKMLCGSGVGFKLVQALIKKGDFNLIEGWEKWLLDMVGIATLSDMVPLTGENRVFAHFGMIVLKKTRRKGLLQLFKDLRVRQNILTETDVTFSITPRINAASRMGEPMAAFTMLSSQDEIEAQRMVSHLHEINDERKGHVASMVRQIKETLKKKYAHTRPHAVVIGNTNWRPSLLGLAATKILEEYMVPVFLWGRGEGSDLKGSARSPKGIDLVQIMTKVPSPILETFGGHMNAGGFVVSMTGVDMLEHAITSICKDEMSVPKKDIPHVDYQLELKDVSYQLLRELQHLAPYGMDNAQPRFVFPSVTVQEKRFFGKEKAHVEFIFSDQSGTKPAIMFFPPDVIQNIKVDTIVDLIGTVEYDPFKNGPRLRIEEILQGD